MILHRDGFPQDPALDLAVSRAVLSRVAAGEQGPTLRVYRPGPTVAFGRRDRLLPGFAAALEATASHGFVGVLRPAGGHAAAYDERSLIYEELRPVDDAGGAAGDQVSARFAAGAARIVEALRALDLDARVGEIPGEYCAGAHSVSIAGRFKVVGIAQRVVRGAALLTAMVVVGGAPTLRPLLVDVYRALELPMDPTTVGALEDAAPGLTVERVQQALIAAGSADSPLVEEPVHRSALVLARDLRSSLDGAS